MRVFAIAALAAALLASPAHASQVGAVTLSPHAQEKFDKVYGANEAAALSAKISEQLAAALDARGVAADKSVRIETTIIEATPDRPTYKQLAETVTMDRTHSFALGGAILEARLIDSSGRVLSEVKDNWYANDLRLAPTNDTWQSADRAIAHFANKVANKLAGAN